MTDAATVRQYSKDPKQVLDEAIDEAFVEEQVVITPPRNPLTQARALTVLTRLVAATAMAVCVSLAATIIARMVTRRAVTPSRTSFHRMRGRRVGVRRFHFGRFGRAFLVYTYKVPQVHIHLPQMTYKIPPICVKLSAPSR